MTRKDFEGIAKALKGADPTICESIADYLATTNPRFDRARFLKACGMRA